MAVITTPRPIEAVEGSPERRPVLTVSVVTGVIVGALVLLIAIRPAVDNDLWFHLRTARWMLDHHDWVGVDPFTHTRPGVARVQTDWLSQLAYYGVWRWTGLAGVAVFVAGLATGALLLLYRTLTGPAAVRAGVVVLTAAASSIFWSARPQMLTFVGTVVVSALLRTWRRQPDRQWIWLLVPVFWLWGNGHGGVVYGVLILGGTLVGEVVDRFLGRSPLTGVHLRRLGLVSMAAIAALIVNPSGWRIYELPFHQVSASTRFVDEYRPPHLGDATALPFFLMLGLTIAVMVWGWRRLAVADALLVLGSAVFALQFTRSIPFFAVLAAPVLATQLATLVGDRASDRERASGPLVVTAGVLVLLVVVLGVTRLDADRVDRRLHAEFPVDAVAWIEAEQPPGELFNTFDWGGYVMWEAPDHRVSIDGRTDVYDDYLDTYFATISAARGWEDELDAEGIGTVLVDTGSPLAEALTADGDWRLAYEDGVAVVFVRNGFSEDAT